MSIESILKLNTFLYWFEWTGSFQISSDNNLILIFTSALELDVDVVSGADKTTTSFSIKLGLGLKTNFWVLITLLFSSKTVAPFWSSKLLFEVVPSGFSFKAPVASTYFQKDSFLWGANDHLKPTFELLPKGVIVKDPPE